ncbi:hypothetical protein FCG67_11965 [Rhodococcus oryzae]|uniref:Uncharacterized protein n=1 Tax=Rhodococcus oryzae TaxID=2571143 RepID=A0ABY2RJM9_9NOCA|nr:hypothetical protein [Rhodococcus oryzae]TJZ77787.1 hypothetical protein FCG67_11965 [Rhodococcus oryzae]
MTTFIALVLLMIALQGVFVAVTRRGRDGEPSGIRGYRFNHFRPDPASGSVNVVDRDAERMFADLQAVRHRAPHS